MIDTIEKLYKYIHFRGPWDAVVVEGYDGVGKGRILSLLSNRLRVIPYRPDYNFWQMYNHHQPDRWKISGFFWDVFSHFHQSSGSCAMLFDRGVISGAVYNHDDSIAVNYKALLRDMKVLHVLVTCSEEDYYKFAGVRKSDTPADYKICEDFTKEYKRLLELSGVDYVIYENHYDSAVAESVSETCEGCGHYSHGVCSHPKVHAPVSPNNPRCGYAGDEEVQDKDVQQMQCV